MIRDLETASHLVRRRIHNADGRWFWESTLYEEPPAALCAIPVATGAAAEPLAHSMAAPASRPTSPVPVAPPLPPAPVAAVPVPPEPVLQEQRTAVTTHSIKGDDSNRAETTQKEPPPPYSPYIAAVVLDHSRELGDRFHAPANVTQALHLAAAAGLPEQAFVETLHTARARVRTYQGKQRAGQIGNKMAYYFVVLRDLVGLGVGSGDPLRP